MTKGRVAAKLLKRVALLVAAGGAGWLLLARRRGSASPSFRFARVEAPLLT
jgi:hypothetical protein